MSSREHRLRQLALEACAATGRGLLRPSLARPPPLRRCQRTSLDPRPQLWTCRAATRLPWAREIQSAWRWLQGLHGRGGACACAVGRCQPGRRHSARPAQSASPPAVPAPPPCRSTPAPSGAPLPWPLEVGGGRGAGVQGWARHGRHSARPAAAAAAALPRRPPSAPTLRLSSAHSGGDSLAKMGGSASSDVDVRAIADKARAGHAVVGAGAARSLRGGAGRAPRAGSQVAGRPGDLTAEARPRGQRLLRGLSTAAPPAPPRACRRSPGRWRWARPRPRRGTAAGRWPTSSWRPWPGVSPPSCCAGWTRDPAALRGCGVAPDPAAARCRARHALRSFWPPTSTFPCLPPRFRPLCRGLVRVRQGRRRRARQLPGHRLRRGGWAGRAVMQPGTYAVGWRRASSLQRRAGQARSPGG